MLVGCDFQWVQKETVAISAAALPKCVSAAVAAVPGVSILEARPEYYFLKTPLNNGDRSTPSSAIVVKPDATVTVQFMNWGMWESEAEKQEVTPLLLSLKTSLESHCNDG
jgi:hypothetical protein